MIKVNGKEIEFTKFPNGETNMNHESFPVVDFKTLITDFKYEEDGDLIKLMFVKKFLDTIYYNRHMKLRVYYMPYSRMDRSENGSPFTLKYVSKFINELKFDDVLLVEPHSNVSPALIDKSSSVLVSFNILEAVKREIKFNRNIDYLMFPDLGAQQRLKDMRYKNILIGNKVRDFVSGDIVGLDIIGSKEESSKRVIIVDDLSSKGGTFVHSSIKLKELGFNEVYLIVAHAENTIFKGELFDHIDKVFTTDSMLTEHKSKDNEKYSNQLKVYKMEDLLND